MEKVLHIEFDCHIIYVFQIRNFEMLGLSYLELKILGISREIPSILKTWNFD